MPYALPLDAPYVQYASIQSQTAAMSIGDRTDEEQAAKLSATGSDLLRHRETSSVVGWSDEHHAVAELFSYPLLRHVNESLFQRSVPTTMDVRRFDLLVRALKAALSFSSATSARTQHPLYREIIRMGHVAIPLLLRELKREPDQWFGALKEITGADPVPIAQRGRVRAMAEAWLRWGRDNGITA